MHIFFLIDMRAQRKARCICTYEYICRKVFAAQCARKKHTEQHMGASWLAQEVQFDLAVLWNLRRNGKGKDKQPRRSQKNARKTARIWDLASHLLASERDAPKGKGVSVHDGIDLIPNQNLSPGSLDRMPSRMRYHPLGAITASTISKHEHETPKPTTF